jgi:predicted HicB family RNase H-like nuclease
MMEYKSYIGKVVIDDEAGILSGEVINLRDVITFEGTSVDEIQKAFRESVDGYLEFAFNMEKHLKSRSLQSLLCDCQLNYIKKLMFKQNWQIKA